MYIRMNKYVMLKAIKIGVGSSVAIFIAGLLGIQYATTAGVVTLLTIRNTKKDTVVLAKNRLSSFFVSAVVILGAVRGIEDKSIGFGIFIICLVLFSSYFKWEDSISINAVIGTHIFLMEEQLTLLLLVNELGLVIVGTAVAIICNLYMFDNLEEIKEDTLYIEKELQVILISMADHVQNIKLLEEDKSHIHLLIEHMDKAIHKAFENNENMSHNLSEYYVEYLNMRKNQCTVLLHLYDAVLGIKTSCKEMVEVAQIMVEIGESIHKTVGIRALIAELEEVIVQMKKETLPQTPDEFISKAQVFYILEELEELLRLKGEFLKTLTPEEMESYWGE
ncbi:MAG: aromatic acid exporter family protein [Eubacteriales bacterium]